MKTRTGERNGPATAQNASESAATAIDAASAAHDEWLLDEALMETFPASDPVSPALGG